jgi:ribose-phosphate pyrophosphokinase
VEIGVKKRLMLFAGSSHPALAKAVAKNLGIELGEANLKQFPNGELHCRYEESIRGADVFILQSHCQNDGFSLNDAIFQQGIMMDAATRASAKRVTAVCPYLGYSRQDRKATGREPISSKYLYNIFQTAGVDRVMSIDMHSSQAQGFFDGPVDHLTAMQLQLRYLEEHYGSNIVVVSPDAGRVKVIERFSNQLGGSRSTADIAIVHKTRQHGKAEAKAVVGDVAGRVCVLIDDMVDTAGTICAAAEILKKEGAKSVIVLATHAIFSEPAAERLDAAPIDRVIVTDTLPIPARSQLKKLEIISVAGIIADAIMAVFTEDSVSVLFDKQNQF